MVKIRQMRLASYVAILLIVVMYVTPIAGFAAKPKKAEPKPEPVAVKSVVVFPFNNDAKSSIIEDLPASLANAIQASLNHSVSYRGTAFTDRMPSLMRALQELTLKTEDLKGPFGTEKPQIMTAVKIAHEMVADYVLVGSIDEVKVDVDKKTAEVTISALLADGRTGETVKTLAATGITPVSTNAASEVELVSLAAGDAVTKMVKDIAPEQTPIPATAAIQNPKKKSGLKKFILPILLAVGIGLAVSQSGGNGNSEADPLDPPPVVPF